MRALNTVDTDQIFGLLDRAFGPVLGQSWSPITGHQESVTRALMVPAAAGQSMEMSPLHQRHAIREFVIDQPLALEQIMALIGIASDVVSDEYLDVGEVRLAVNLDDEQVLSLYLRISLPLDEFLHAKEEIRSRYHQEFPDECQLVSPVILRIVE